MTEVNNKQYSLNINEKNFIHSLNKVVKIDVKSKLQFMEVKGNDYIKYFDYDKIKGANNIKI